MTSPNQPDYATLGTNSTITAKRLEVRSDDFSTSSKSVCLKAYDSTEAYTVFLPKDDPFTVSPNTDTVLTYDVVQGKFVWKQGGGGGSFFIQGATTATKDDENGNVLTVTEEVPLVAGDAGYDPTRDPTHASYDAALGTLYKVSTGFTDTIYNQQYFAAGKASTGGTVYTKTTGMYFDWSSGVNPNLGTVDLNKQAKDKLLLTTKTDTNHIANSSACLLPDKAELIHSTSQLNTKVSITDNKVKMEAQAKEIMDADLNVVKTMVYPLQSSATATTVQQKTYSYDLSFGSDTKNGLKIDNSDKKISSDCTHIEFGDANNKHRFAIVNGKLYLQKKSGDSWVGADVVVDGITSYTGSAVINENFPQVTGTGLTATVSVNVTTTGTDVHHWKLQIDDLTSADFLKDSTDTQAGTSAITTGAGLQPGIHDVTVWPVLQDGTQIGEKVKKFVTIPA